MLTAAYNVNVFFLVLLYVGAMFVILRQYGSILASPDQYFVGASPNSSAATPPDYASLLGHEASSCMDLFIPYHQSDHEVFIIRGGLDSIREHVKGWRRIFIVSAENASLAAVLSQDERIFWRSEDAFSFSKHPERLRSWYFQQALKLLAPLEMADMCNTFLVLDADLHFIRDWSFASSDHSGRWAYLFPHRFPGGSFEDLARRSQESTQGIIGINSLNTLGTLCTVHHHMVMQKDVLRALAAHVAVLHGAPLLQVFVDAQARGWWASEFDIYLSFASQHFRDRIQLVDFPYIHAREKARCSKSDALAFRDESDVVFMSCHDHYVGHDLCSGSSNNCSSTVAFCDRISNGNCNAGSHDLLPCRRGQ